MGDLRYSWRKLKKQAADVADTLATLQARRLGGQRRRPPGACRWCSQLCACSYSLRLMPCPAPPRHPPTWPLPPSLPPPLSPSSQLPRTQVGFKRTLLQDVKAFVADAVAFRADWEASGPTVPGLDPMDATDRLRKFQQLFEVGRAGRVGAWAGGRCAGGRAMWRLRAGQWQALLRGRTERAAPHPPRLPAPPTCTHHTAGAQAQVGLLLQRRGAVWAAGHAVPGAGAHRGGDHHAGQAVQVGRVGGWWVGPEGRLSVPTVGAAC